MIIDGENTIFGRLATVAAKKALLGEKVDIVNCEKIVFTGKKEIILAKYDRIKKMGGPIKGPFVSINPEKFVKRIIRGMLPYKQEKGREAFERIMCYKGVPSQFSSANLEKVSQKEIRVNTITVAEVCNFIGGKQ
jgi:large subunit ribosomal protein L13